jgi:hypothetical protein
VLVVRGGKFSCEPFLLGYGNESNQGNPNRVRRKLLRRASRRNSSCEAESSRARQRVLVRGGRKLCERIYLKELFGDGKTTQANEFPAREHHLSDLKT